jgi:hypothetical protein
MAGYSGTPLPRKLGIKEGTRVGFSGAPARVCAVDEVWSGLRLVIRLRDRAR